MTYDFAILVGLYTGAAAVVDLRMKRIPNYITVPAAILGLLYNSFAPQGLGVGMSLAGFAVGFALLLLPWLMGGGGMGDVKLLAALGTWMGPWMILVAFGLAAIFASLMALGIMAHNTLNEGVSSTKRRYLAAGNQGGTAGSSAGRKRRTLPFAVPVALSSWLLVSWMAFKHGLGV